MKRPLILSLLIFTAITFLPGSANAQWVKTALPSIASVVNAGNYLIAGTYSGIFRSSDSGLNWIQVTSSLKDTLAYCFATIGKYLFVGTPYGVYRSSDSGSNWIPIKSGLSDTNIQSLAVMGDILFAGIYPSGVFRSSDSGANWVTAYKGTLLQYLDILVVKDSNLFAGVYRGGVFRSTDSGTTWDSANSGLTTNYVMCMAVLGPYLFVGTNGWDGVYRSINNGNSWAVANSGISPPLHFGNMAISGNNIFASSDGGIYISSDSGTIWKGVNNGLTYNNMIHVDKLVADRNAIFIETRNQNIVTVWKWRPYVPILIPCTPNPTYNRRQQLNWYPAYDSSISVFRIQIDTSQRFSSPILSETTTDTFFIPANDLPLGTLYWRVGNDADSLAWSSVSSFMLFDLISGTWEQTSGPLNSGSVKALAMTGNDLFAGTSSGGVFLSVDNGTTWTPVNTGLTGTDVNALAVKDSLVFAALGSQVYFSTNKGANWNAQGFALPQTVLSLLIKDNYLFAGLSSGQWLPSGFNIYGIYYTPITGTTWMMRNSGLPYYAYYIGGGGTLVYYYSSSHRALAVSNGAIFTSSSSGPYRSINDGALWGSANSGIASTVLSFGVNGNTLYVGCFGRSTDNYGGVRISSNNGNNWTVDTAGIPAYTSVQCFAVSKGIVFAGTNSGGVFLSVTTSLPWINFNDGLADTDILSFAASNSYLFAGTGSSGVWRRLLSSTPTAIKQQAYLPERISFNILSRNRSVSVAFSLPHSSPVQLKVYNLSGHLVATLCDKPMQTGAHTIAWDTRSLASGCYMVRMQTGTTTQVKAIPLFR